MGLALRVCQSLPQSHGCPEKTQRQDNLVQVRRIVVQHGLCPWAEETLRRL